MGPRAAALLLLLLPCPAAGGEGLPGFKLERLKAAELWEPCPGISIPPVSPPARVSELFPGRRSGFAPPPELYPLYRPYAAGFAPMGPGLMRLRTGSGGPGGTDNIKLTGSAKVTVNAAGGRAEVKLPRAEFQDPLPGDAARFFVKFSSDARSAELSWALVLCSAGVYLGYKGATIALPAAAAGLYAAESLALGYGKEDLRRTHPWLAARLGGRGSDGLCLDPFPAGNRDLALRALPRVDGDFSFDYDARRNILNITWPGR